MSAQFLPAPQGKRLGSVDVFPNLLATTLAVVAFLPLQAGKLYASAPAVKAAVQCELLTRPLTLGINPQPAVQRLDQSAPPPKFAVTVDQIRAPLTLGMNPQPSVRQWDLSAPAIKSPIGLDAYPNLTCTTLAPVTAAPFKPVDTSQLQPKYQVFPDTLQRPVTLGLNPQPSIQRLDQSAPPPKAPVYVDQPLQTPLTLGINPQPAVLQLTASAPPPKYAVQVDAYPNTLVLGFNPQPQIRQWDLSSPPPKFAVQVDAYPNLNTTTLAAPVLPLALPLGLPVDTAQFMPKFQVQVDAYPNVLVLGYPTPAPDTGPGSNAGGGGGGNGAGWSGKFEFSRRPDAAELARQALEQVPRGTPLVAATLPENSATILTEALIARTVQAQDDDDDEEAIALLLQ